MTLLTKRRRINQIRKTTAFMAILMILISLFDVMFSYKVNAETEILKLTGSVNSANNSYTVGNSLIITTTASGGTSPYQYQYEYMKSGDSYHIYKQYSAASSITMNTSGWSAHTDYTIRVTVKDSTNTTATYTSSVRLNAETVPTPVISSFSAQNTAKIGDKVKLNCDAANGTTPYQYKFTYIDINNSEKTIRDYSTSDSTTWDTSSLSAGSYTVKVYVKDKNNKIVSQKSTIIISKTPTLSPTVSTDPSNSTVTKGNDITFTVNDHTTDTSDYPPHPYTFKFEYKKSNASNYTVLQNYSDNEKYVLSTKDFDAGTYTLRATVKDNNGKEYSKTCNFTVTIPKITFDIDGGTKEFFTGGGNEKAILEVKNVKGGISDEYEYKFEYVKYGNLNDTSLTPPADNSNWQSLKDFSSESTADFTVNEEAGIYAVRISVQNVGNNDSNLIYSKIIQNYIVKVKVEHTLSDINSLIDKIDTWYSNSVQGDMHTKIVIWATPDNEHYDEYPFDYVDYKAAYDAAKASNTDGNKDYDTLYANLETQFDKLKRLVNSGYVSPDLETGDTPIGIANSIFLLYKSLLPIVTDTFKSLADSGTTSKVMFGFDYNAVADTIFPLFRTFAYALIIIFAGVNALESALQYEMFTMRGGVKILGRLVFAKLWIDLSLVICRAIISISTEWLNSITNLTMELTNNIQIGVSLQSSDAWIVGKIIDFFNGILLSLGIYIIIIPLCVLIVFVFVKLFVRSFELAMLQCVSPVFFACLTSENTKQYFKKFILTYISVVVEVVFMAVVWYIYISYL